MQSVFADNGDPIMNAGEPAHGLTAVLLPFTVLETVRWARFIRFRLLLSAFGFSNAAPSDVVAIRWRPKSTPIGLPVGGDEVGTSCSTLMLTN